MSCAKPNPLHWEDLRNSPRQAIISRSGVKEVGDSGVYELNFLDSTYLVDPIKEEIKEIRPKPERLLEENFQILLIRYLVAGNGGPESGKDISEKDLPGGVTFFQGPHELHTRPIAKRFGSDPEGFKELASSLGAHKIDYGDIGMRFYPFPDIPVTYILWTADNEFPSSVSALFDSSISKWFELDMVFTLVWVLTDRIMEHA